MRSQAPEHLNNPIRSLRHLPVQSKNPGKLLGPKLFALMSSCHDHVPLSFLTHLGSTFEALDAIHKLTRFLGGWAPREESRPLGGP